MIDGRCGAEDQAAKSGVMPQRTIQVAELTFYNALFVQALEYQMQQGLVDGARQNVFLMPLTAQHDFGEALQADACMIRLLLC